MSEVPCDGNKLPYKFGDGHYNSFWAMSNYLLHVHSKMSYSYTIIHSVHALQWNQTASISSTNSLGAIPTWEFWSYATSIVTVLFL